jgi:aminoglycoside phosphotransferase family enzyme/predicted kinase
MSVTAPLLDRLAESLPGPVEARETHTSWVLLSGETALKVRKPVQFAFLDYSTLERRYAAAVEEVRVNETLAPGVYRGVRSLVGRDGRLAVGPFGADTDAVEYAVEMRRFDEHQTMAALCAAGGLRTEEIDAVARVLADFHATAAGCDGGARAFRVRVREDVSELEALLGSLPALERYAGAALARSAAQLDARAAQGLCRDGHGDLRAEHVVFEQRPLIVDRIEFDPSLRRVDVASDLAFLTMDLEDRGCAWAARHLLAAYRRAGGDPGDARLHALFGWQRALVRAKVALLRDDEPAARRLLALAERLAWRERLAGVVLVLGPPASGKSTLARALADRAGLPLLGSDVTRKALLGVNPTARLGDDAYRVEVARAVYGALGYRAACACARHGGVVIDATGRSHELRQLLVEHLGTAGPITAIVCETPLELRLARAHARLADPERVSDADPEVVRRLATRFESLTSEEDQLDRLLGADCGQPLKATLHDLVVQLDAR